MAPNTTAPNGILPISIAAIQKSESTSNSNHNHNRNPGRRAPTARLKVVIRRLPPGLTLNEYTAAVGEEWKPGKGKVDWSEFRAGKVSKDQAKPSRPTRVYLHLTDQKHLGALSDKIKQCTFSDAKNTTNDSALIGPPVLEFAPYPRVPGGRRRNDARQGTIDQDPDFQLFLESLTNPIVRGGVETETLEVRERVTTTPLIEAIRERKAAREKSAGGKAGAGKTGKSREEGRNGKDGKEAQVGVATPEKGRKQGRGEKGKPVQEVVKTPQREVSAVKVDVTPGAAGGTPATANQAAQGTPKSNDRRRERPQMSVAAKIQRDLGLGQTRRRDTAGNTASPATSKQGDTVQTSGAASPAPSSAASSPHRSRAGRSRQSSRAPLPVDKSSLPGTGAMDGAKTNTPASQPTILAKSTAPATNTGPKASTAPQLSAPPTPLTTKPPAPPPSTPHPPPTTSPAPIHHAFLKHANPSQGITEPLILQALSPYGPVLRVEIDKRKGFAYVDFGTAEGLRRAIAGSPVKVGQGAVQVLEKKDRRGMGAGGGAGVGGGRGGMGHRERGERVASGRGGPVRAEGASPGGATVGPAAVVAAPSATLAPVDRAEAGG